MEPIYIVWVFWYCNLNTKLTIVGVDVGDDVGDDVVGDDVGGDDVGGDDVGAGEHSAPHWVSHGHVSGHADVPLKVKGGIIITYF